MTEEPKAPEGNQLYTAVCVVMTDFVRLKKGDTNDHGRYDFTSVDDFKDALRPMLAKNGLSIHVSQKKFEMIEFTDSKDKRKSVAQYDMEITLTHISGERDEPEGMTVALPFTGAQTSGAARSYAVKEWMKSRFLASSGDEQDEADLLEQARDGLRLSKQEARVINGELYEEMRQVTLLRDHVKLGEWWQENRHRIETQPKDWFILLKTEYVTNYKELKAQEDLDKMSDGELDEMAQQQGNV